LHEVERLVRVPADEALTNAARAKAATEAKRILIEVNGKGGREN
jgi:hypothetical protein